jgi:hypothetical protein
MLFDGSSTERATMHESRNGPAPDIPSRKARERPLFQVMSVHIYFSFESPAF